MNPKIERPERRNTIRHANITIKSKFPYQLKNKIKTKSFSSPCALPIVPN